VTLDITIPSIEISSEKEAKISIVMWRFCSDRCTLIHLRGEDISAEQQQTNFHLWLWPPKLKSKSGYAWALSLAEIHPLSAEIFYSLHALSAGGIYPGVNLMVCIRDYCSFAASVCCAICYAGNSGNELFPAIHATDHSRLRKVVRQFLRSFFVQSQLIGFCDSFLFQSCLRRPAAYGRNTCCNDRQPRRGLRL